MADEQYVKAFEKYILPLRQRCIRPVIQDIFVCRADNAATIEIQFFYTVGCPAYNARHCEYWSINLLGQPNHLIYETGIEIYITANRLVGLAALGYQFYSLLFEQSKEVVLFFAPFFLRQLTGKFFQLYGAGVRLSVNSMTDTVNKPGLIVSVLIKYAIQVGIYLIDILPIENLCLQVVKHID